MEVTGTNKSVYFDAETMAKAAELMRANGVTLSQLIRDLIREKHAELKPAKAAVKK